MFHLHGISLQLQELIELRLGLAACELAALGPNAIFVQRPLTPLSKVRFGTLRVHLSEFLLGKIIIPEF